MGEYRHALDDKGRLTLPARLREGLGQPFVATRGLENCIFLYPLEAWEAMSERAYDESSGRASARAFERLFFPSAEECRCDGQGRVLFSPRLRQHGRLERDAVVLGVRNRVEVWSETEWETYVAAAANDYAALAEQIPGLRL